MTEKEKAEMAASKARRLKEKFLANRRRGYSGRFLMLAKAHGLPELRTHQRLALLDACCRVRGEPIPDPCLRILYGLAARGLFSSTGAYDEQESQQQKRSRKEEVREADAKSDIQV